MLLLLLGCNNKSLEEEESWNWNSTIQKIRVKAKDKLSINQGVKGIKFAPIGQYTIHVPQP